MSSAGPLAGVPGIDWELTAAPPSDCFRIGAVSFLNTVPLVYGMLHGQHQRQVDLQFSLPAECAEQLERGQIDVGILPVAEIARQGLAIVSDVGIAAVGPVRSILLFARVPWNQVRSLAADTASRTSVQLARVVLREQFGAKPSVVPQAPDLQQMLSIADAALIIGDPALRLEPSGPLPHGATAVLDLAEVWTKMTRLPFVFAAWAACLRSPGEGQALRTLTADSYSYGEQHLSEIVESEHARRGISRELADAYLRHHLHYELGEREWEGMRLFLSLAGLPAISL